jgi:uncharacterized membrane protein
MVASNQPIVCVFDGAERAQAVRTSLQALDLRPAADVRGNIAVVSKSALGVVSVKETRDLKFNLSLVGGLPFAGIVAGLIAGQARFTRLSPAACVAVGGAIGLAAGVVISALDLGFRDDTLYQIGTGLATEHSALIMLVRPREANDVRARLIDLGGTLIQDTLAPEIVDQLTTHPRQMWSMKP